MTGWKRVLLVAVGFGAGFAGVLCAVGGGWIWYQARPKPPKPWNSAAIKAVFDDFDTSGEHNELNFYYVLENTTDFDYRLDDMHAAHFTGIFLSPKSLHQFSSPFETIELPIYVPARHRARVQIHFPYPTTFKLKSEATPEERKKYHEDVRGYVKDTFKNLGGFSLFDEGPRYEIDFPATWGEPEKK